MKFQNRFAYGFTPETGKKADLMFVQHMVASLKTKGRMATIMPHGVLFRGGAEKVIRKGLVDANLIEAIISLPPALFYGTGIPACIIIINKNKDEKLRDKIFFINADAEYGEGKVQNYLRPEDIEKINFVFGSKLNIPKYSRLVEKKVIAEQNDYNLNIRRYIDNTPEPEPEDVKAHLIGGIPISEIEQQHKQYNKFGFTDDAIFKNKNKNYRLFLNAIGDKSEIKRRVDNDSNILRTITAIQKATDKWWLAAKDDFAKIAATQSLKQNVANPIPQVKLHLLTTLKEAFKNKKVLDEFQISGVFVNWWTNIKYDLKTIATIGWVPSLVPKKYYIETYFKTEQRTISKTENLISEKDIALQETIDGVDYEGEEGEEITVKQIKAYLKDSINDLQPGSNTKQELSSTINEISKLVEQLNEIIRLEKQIKEAKEQLRDQLHDLHKKVEFKMYGINEEKEELNSLLTFNLQKLEGLKAKNKKLKDSKEAKKIAKDIANIDADNQLVTARINNLDTFLDSIGGIITGDECKTLILQKHNNLIQDELVKYLNAEKRALISGLERLWDKYAVPSKILEAERQDTLNKLNKFLTQLNYLN